MLAFIYVGAHFFDDGIGSRAQRAQHIDEQTITRRKRVEDVGRLDSFAALRLRSFGRALEKIGNVRPDANSLADVLSRGLQPALDRPRYCERIRSVELNRSGSSFESALMMCSTEM